MKRFRLSLFVILACSLGAVSARADRLVVVAGGGDKEGNGIPATEARLREPFGAEFDSAGRMWIIEMVSGNRLLMVDKEGKLTHVGGQLKPGLSGDNGPVIDAQFNGPHNLVVLPDGNILIGDTWNGRIRHVDVKTGIVTSLKGYEAPLEKAKGSGPYCITLAPDGKTLHVANLLQILAVDLTTGTSKVVAGNGKKGIPEDGAVATEAPLVDPRAVAADRDGNIYILERNGNALRVVNKEGRIRTVVNKSGKKGITGNGGPAIDATMNGPKHICIDRDNSVVIADAENHCIRRYQPANGYIYLVAGTSRVGTDGTGGHPKQAELNRPHGVSIHPETDELYITDSYNNRILKIVRE